VFRLVDESLPPVVVGDAPSIKFNHDEDEDGDEAIDVVEQNIDEDTGRRLDDNANPRPCCGDDQDIPAPPLGDDDKLNKNDRHSFALQSDTPGNTIQVTAAITAAWINLSKFINKYYYVCGSLFVYV